MDVVGISSEWEGLAPDSPVWSEALLASAALEITDRNDPLKPPEVSGADDDTEKVCLMCELAAMQRDYGILEKNHDELLKQFQTINRRGKR